MNILMTIFVTGIAILVAALVLNYIATSIGLATWYDFVKASDRSGISLLSYAWLFIIYPGCLGAAAVLVVRLIHG